MSTARTRSKGAPRILVVYKKSAYQLYAVEKREPKVRAMIRRGAPTARILLRSHEVHEHARATVVEACRRAGAHVKELYRAHMRSVARVDLVVTVGGDGTVLDASHRVGTVPLLGVNSNPERSVGFLTGTDAAGFEKVLHEVLDGSLSPRRLMRLAVTLNGRDLRVPILNDLLFTHANPAAMSRYKLQNGARSEEHKSSGVWVATPTGSTAAISSAGGDTQPMDDRRFQWRVREPYARPGKVVAMKGGYTGARGRLSLTCLMRDGAVFLDGSHIRHAVGMGDVLEVTAHPQDLWLVRPR